MGSSKKRVQQPTSFRFKPITIEILRDIAGEATVMPDGGEVDSRRGFIESLIRQFIYTVLSGECVPNNQVVWASMPYEQLGNVWLDYRRALRGEAGYELYRHSKTAKKNAGMVSLKQPEFP